MLGISWTEFLVIVLVAICVVPVKDWPNVARFFGRVFKWVRKLIWKITDVSEQIQQRIDLEKPINDLISSTTDDIFGDIRSEIQTKRKSGKCKTKK